MKERASSVVIQIIGITPLCIMVSHTSLLDSHRFPSSWGGTVGVTNGTLQPSRVRAAGQQRNNLPIKSIQYLRFARMVRHG